MTASQPPEVREFSARLADLQRRREAATAAMAAATGSATSDNGAVSLTVTAEGVLLDLRFGVAADPADPALTALLLTTARDARREALQTAADGVAAAVGPDSEAVAVLRRQAAGLRPGDGTSTPATRQDFTEVPDGD